MVKKWLLAATIVISAFYLTGCSTGGSFVALNLTNVELSDKGTEIVARDIEGISEAGYLLGFSFSSGNFANTIALVRVSGTATLYDSAVKDVWKNYEAKHGSVEGKKLALVNIRYDADILNLFIYTQAKLFIHADVVEFKQ